MLSFKMFQLIRDYILNFFKVAFWELWGGEKMLERHYLPLSSL